MVHWDVINEMIDEHQGPLNHTFYIDQSGNENIRADIHIHVKENYPHNKFYVNDYGIIMDTAHRFSSFQKLLRDLFSRGVQIDGIGLQSHINGEHKNLLCQWLMLIVSHNFRSCFNWLESCQAKSWNTLGRVSASNLDHRVWLESWWRCAMGRPHSAQPDFAGLLQAYV